MDTKPISDEEITYYSAITDRRVEWLWYPYIPYGKLTLLQGDPGDGKSTFMLQLVARITTKRKMPDGKPFPECQNVIYQCSEDNPNDTIKPRLIAAGADCDRVAFISEESRGLTIDDRRVEDAIVRTQARLCVFDPIQAYIPPDSDMLNAAKMRAVMKRLARVAERTRCAIVLIGHMTKTANGKNLYRGLGSIDIAAVARSVLMIERDPEDSSIRYMFPVKSSLAHEGCAIRFMFDKLFGFQFLGTSNYKSTLDPEVEDNSKSLRTERLIRAPLFHTGYPTYVFIDEFYLLLMGEHCSEFLFTQWKRARKYYACYTGITQDVDDMLQSHRAQTMLANSELLVLFNQSAYARNTLSHLLSITPEQLSSVANAPTGNGLILCGGNIIPFVNRIPSDNPLYPLVTTKTEKDVIGRDAAAQAEG